MVPYAIKARSKSTRGADKSVFEFGGPPGAYATMLSLPGVIFFLYYACGKDFVMPGANLRALADMRPCSERGRASGLRVLGGAGGSALGDSCDGRWVSGRSPGVARSPARGSSGS